jgi:hypothetical protein
MSAVMLKYRPIQYVEDPFRGETRNIGVIAYGMREQHFRCLGDQNAGEFDLAPFSRLSRTARDNAWVFNEWATWFKDLAAEDLDCDDKLQERLDQLERDGAPFIAGREGIVEVPDGESTENAVAWLYDRLVREPQARNSDFQEALENLLAQSGMMLGEGFEKDIEIEFTSAGAAPVRINADYALTDDSRRAIFKVIRFKGARTHLVKRANDVIYTFQQAVEHGFAAKEFCFALTDKPTKQNKDLHALISRHGVTVNVMGNLAAETLNLALKGESPT